jgi:hypothetical protein
MKYLLAALSVPAGFLAWAWLFRTHDGKAVMWGPSGQPDSPWDYLELGAAYMALLVGVVLGVLVRGLLELKQRGRETIHLSRYIRQASRDMDLWISVFASPVLFGGILRQGVSLEVMPLLFFSLQTGFSSHLAIRSLLRPVGPEDAGDKGGTVAFDNQSTDKKTTDSGGLTRTAAEQTAAPDVEGRLGTPGSAAPGPPSPQS